MPMASGASRAESTVESWLAGVPEKFKLLAFEALQNLKHDDHFFGINDSEAASTSATIRRISDASLAAGIHAAGHNNGTRSAPEGWQGQNRARMLVRLTYATQYHAPKSF